MWLTKIFTAVLVALLGLLPSSCTTAKNSAARPHAPVGNIAPAFESPTNKILGELDLTNHYETCLSLGSGRSFTIKPNLLDRSHVQLILQVESKFANGGTKDLSVVQVITKKGKQFDVAVGDMNLTLTPNLVDE